MSPEICTCDLNDKSVGYQKDSEQSYYLKAYLRTQKTLHYLERWVTLTRVEPLLVAFTLQKFNPG